MLFIPETPAEAARHYLKIREAYGLSDAHPNNSIQAAKAGLAEAITHHSDGLNLSLAEVFVTADAVMEYRDDVAGVNPAIYDLPSLSIAVGSPELALLACKINGGYSHHRNKWQDDGDDVSRAIFVNSLYLSSLTISMRGVNAHDKRIRRKSVADAKPGLSTIALFASKRCS